MSTENKARSALERLDGGKAWCKGNPINGKGKRCLIGALVNADQLTINAYLDIEEDPIAPIVERVIAEQYPDRYHSDRELAGRLYGFNDHADTKYEDVERVLEKVAVQVDEILS